uniref:MD-2-related lipid-recognition domain-containing protein n=1 Tax=Panagrolaimus davidi TaxID=227884 RepID=A0A914QU89_9BILA
MEVTDPYGNLEYPLHFTKPIYARANLTNNGNILDNLKLDIYLANWGGWSGCEWHRLDTLGILNNLDACTNGIICPILPGNQNNVMALDFTKFNGFIDLLNDDVSYQIQLVLTAPSNEQFCMTVQTRALT